MKTLKDKTVIRLAELACGTTIVILHALTGVNGALIILGALLVGVSSEVIVGLTKK